MTEPTSLPVKTESSSTTPASVPAPFAPLTSLRQEVDRLFDQFSHWSWPTSFRHAMDFDLPRLPIATMGVAPAVDIAEKDQEFLITAELPGIDEKDIDVSLINGTLIIKGEKKEESEKAEKGLHLSERRYGSFMRSFQVPDGVDSSKIEATFAKSILTVKLPKTSDAQKSQKIAVKAA